MGIHNDLLIWCENEMIWSGNTLSKPMHPKESIEWFFSVCIQEWSLGTTSHSNDSHQCPILAADFVIFYYGTENEEAIQAGAGSEWGIEVGYSFSIPKQVSCQYGTLMWIIAVFLFTTGITVVYPLIALFFTLLFKLLFILSQQYCDIRYFIKQIFI